MSHISTSPGPVNATVTCTGSARKLTVLIHAPEDFNNLCVMARTLECFGISECLVHDPHRLVRDRYGKSYRRRLRTVSAGAFFCIKFERVEDSLACMCAHRGRKIAAVPESDATCVYDFSFQDNDMLIFGAEAKGLPISIVEACDESIVIPQSGVTQSLNLCVAAGIILSEWRRQNRKA